jgi:STAS-like domain of unknown function (DUF4325)
MVIRVVDMVVGADTSDQGAAVFARLQAALATDSTVTVSFDGLKTATSSFVNASFVPLLERFDFREIKQRLRIVDSTRQINDMIRTRLEREASITT